MRRTAGSGSTKNEFGSTGLERNVGEKKKKAIYFTAVIPAIVNQSVTSLSSISAAVSSWSLASSRLPSAR